MPNTNLKPSALTILAALRTGDMISPLDALNRFGCMSLSQRVGEIKRSGVPVAKRMIKTQSGKRVAQYYIVKVEMAG